MDSKPTPPKKPINVFFAFVQKHTEEIKKQNPEAKQKDIMSLAGKLFEKRTEAQKKKDEDEQKAKINQYTIELEEYENKYGKIEKKPRKSKKAKKGEESGDENPKKHLSKVKKSGSRSQSEDKDSKKIVKVAKTGKSAKETEEVKEGKAKPKKEATVVAKDTGKNDMKKVVPKVGKK